MRRLLILPLAALTLAFAGCGGSSSSDSSSSASTPAASTDAGAPAAGGEAKVGMENIAFNPKEITVKVGQKITWTNDENVPHDVTADSGADFKSETLNKDGTFSYTPKKAGVIEYECTIHPGMVGTVTVEK